MHELFLSGSIVRVVVWDYRYGERSPLRDDEVSYL